MIYFGIVENVNDPLNAGRVQVRVYPFYRDFSVADLPWAYVERSTDLGQTSGRGLNMHNLMEGTQVTVEFLDKQMQQPIVRGIIPRESDFDNMQSFVVHRIKFLNGSEIIVDETPDAEAIKVIDPNKNYILMDTSGITIHVGDEKRNIVIESAGKINVTADNDITVNTKKNASIKSEGDTKIESAGKMEIKSEGDMNIQSSGNMTIESSGSLDVKSSGSATVKSTGTLTLEGTKTTIRNILGMNQLCSLPVCLFTGKPHQAPSSD